MTDLSKRRLVKAAGLTALAATAFLAACGKKEPAPAPAPVASAPAKPEPLKAAWIYVQFILACEEIASNMVENGGGGRRMLDANSSERPAAGIFSWASLWPFSGFAF